MATFVKKSYFTLLELLVVLLIISFGIILTGVKIKEIYYEQRFLTDTQEVLNHFAMAQDLMLLMDTDVKVKLAPHSETQKLQIWLEVEKPLKDAWAQLIERKLTLNAIQSYDFNGFHGKKATFQFSLGKMSTGILTLYEGKKNDSKLSDKRQFQIELAGYPRPLKGIVGKNQEYRRAQNDKMEKSQALYPVELYEKLYANKNQENEQN